MHLLVIDDDLRICSVIAAIATARGWSVHTTTEKVEFEALLHTRQPDAVIIDLHLGVADGVEVLRFLAGEHYRGPVVLISGFDDRVLAAAKDVGTSFGLDITGILEKPIRAATMRSLLVGLEHGPRVGPIPQAPAQPQFAAAAAPVITCHDITQALAAGEMQLEFQPIVSADMREVVSMEALIRWQHPRLGLVSPDQFIPIAESDEGTIDTMTMWVIRTALAQRQLFERVGIWAPIAVNVSGSSLRRVEFPDRVAQLVADADFTPAALTLEMTETIATTDTHRLADILTRLRLKGFGLAIDDLGAGYASLQALQQMPFSCLKIDKSFVSAAATSRTALTIVKSIIEMSRSMRLTSVAEGIETRESAEQMTVLGVDAMQGFYFSRPLPADKLIVWIADRRKIS